MPAALLVRFRPAGPWRLGPDNGAKDRTGRIFHSDSLYSAVTIAMRDLGWLEEWIEATAESPDPAVRLSSCYPYTGRTLLIQPPRHVWPSAQPGKLRWKTARFVPVSLVPALLREETLKEDSWAIDPVSECLLPVTKNGPVAAPFRVVKRSFAAVDRVTETSETAYSMACLQFASGAGMWFAAAFPTDEARDTWENRVRAASRLLADTGLGGARSRGWGRSDQPRFENIDFTRLLTGIPESDSGETAWWLLSAFVPGSSDAVDWKRGSYDLSIRAGRTEAGDRWGELKPALRTVSEGSVLLSGNAPAGAARNVAPADSSHPVYRSGIALAVSIPWKEGRRLPWVAQEAAETEQPPPEPPVEEPPVEVPPQQEPPEEEPPAREPDPEEPPVQGPSDEGEQPS
jgi:CRISPR type III-A-associated RAMP protein Csm4